MLAKTKEEEKEKDLVIRDIIIDLLEREGPCRNREIIEGVLSQRQTTQGSIESTLYNNRHLFKNVAYGVWDLKDNNKTGRLEKLIHKQAILIDHYKELVKESGKNGDTRLGGVEFDQEDIQFQKNVTEAYNRLILFEHYKKLVRDVSKSEFDDIELFYLRQIKEKFKKD